MAHALPRLLPRRGGNNGVARPPWYFLLPSYWLKRTSSAVKQLRKTESGLSEKKYSGSTIAGTSSAGTVPGSPGPAVRVAAELGPASQGQHSEGASTGGAVREAWSVTGTGRPAGSGAAEDEDVAAEAAKMRQLLKLRAAASDSKLKSGLVQDQVMAVVRQADPGCPAPADLLATPFAIEVYGLSKVFKGSWAGQHGCVPAGRITNNSAAASTRSTAAQPSGRNAGDFWAIAGSWFGIEEGQLFCLLGPNGAGKTTTINCLTGDNCWSLHCDLCANMTAHCCHRL